MGDYELRVCLAYLLLFLAGLAGLWTLVAAGVIRR